MYLGVMIYILISCVSSQMEKSNVDPNFVLQQVDCLDPYVHQRIAVLFISYSNESNNSPRPCISPW